MDCGKARVWRRAGHQAAPKQCSYRTSLELGSLSAAGRLPSLVCYRRGGVAKIDDVNTDRKSKDEELNGEVRDNDTQLQFREKHRAKVLHHLITYCALDLLLQMPFGILLPDVSCLQLVGGQRGLLLHRLVVRF